MNQGRPSANIRKTSILKRSKIKKILFQSQETMLLRIRKSGIIEVIKSAIIVKRRIILLGIVLNL